MPSILVNSHGGRIVNPPNPPQFVVPAGVTIHFYIQDGGILPNDEAWQILTALQNFNPPAPNFYTAVAAGTACFDYYALPFGGLDIVNGIQVERPGRRGAAIFEAILGSGDGDSWGSPEGNTVTVERPVLPAVQGGPPYARDAVRLSNIAQYATNNGFTDIHWIACREHW